MILIRSVVLVSILALLGGALSASAAVDTDFLVPDGPVTAQAEFEGTLYLGGGFTSFGRATGGGVPFDRATAALPSGFPQVDGPVYAVAPDGAGGWYIGGAFGNVGGAPRMGAAQVAANLSVTSWAPAVAGTVYAMRRAPDGTVYLGGSFTSVEAVNRTNLAAVNATGSIHPWTGAAYGGPVYALEILGANTIVLGGDFNQVGVIGLPPVGRPRLAAIAIPIATTSAWTPAPTGPVYAIELVAATVPQATFVVGGAFDVIVGLSRSRLAKFVGPGVPEPWNPGADAAVRALEVAGGIVYAGGDFANAGGQPRARVAAFDATTAALQAWSPTADDTVFALSADGVGAVHVGGSFATIAGAPHPRLARVDATTGAPLPYPALPNGTVRALAAGGFSVYAGGSFTATGSVARDGLAAIDVRSGVLLPWAPQVEGIVRALALETHGPLAHTVHIGGAFSSIDGVPRNNFASVDATTGELAALDPSPNGPVNALLVDRDTLYVGGEFSNAFGTELFNLLRIELAADQFVPGFPGAGLPVQALARNNGYLYVGGTQTFPTAQSLLAIRGNLAVFGWGPTMNGSVTALACDATSVYVGGDFTVVEGQSRLRIARLPAASGSDTPLPFTSPLDGQVRALVLADNRLYLGGDFVTTGLPGVAGLRRCLAQLDPVTGADLGALQNATAPGGGATVRSLARGGRWLHAGGTFTNVGGAAHANLARFDAGAAPACPAPPPVPPDPFVPQALASADFDGDGISDLVVCDRGLPRGFVFHGRGIGGVGDGGMVSADELPVDAPPWHVATGDIDANGFPDVALSTNPWGHQGRVHVFLNDGSTFTPISPLILGGRVDGLAIADLDLDGIADLAVCMLDSAGVAMRGSLDVLRGGGSGGAWDGTFESPVRVRSSLTARRVVVSDFNLDGIPDFLVTGKGTRSEVHMGPGLVAQCGFFTLTSPLWEGPSGGAIAVGDLDRDGDLDAVTTRGRRAYIQLKNAVTDATCGSGPWFSTPGALAFNLPSTPRDIALLDSNRDGILDLLIAFDSLGTFEFRPGLGVGNAGNGSFGAPTSTPWSTSGIAVGDFQEDGVPDLALTFAACNQVGVVPLGPPGGGDPPTPLQLVSPNGGELWPTLRGGWSDFAGGELEAAIAVDPATSIDGAFAHASPAPPALNAMQSVVWTRGAGIHLVDVEVSRDGGATWQAIATNVPGTTMPWLVTPPASVQAMIRVVDSFVAGRFDPSDADFTIEAPAVDVPAGDGLPTVAAFVLRDANPARGAMRFRLDVPTASEVDVKVYNVAGRIVRNVAGGTYRAGRHDLAWDARDDRSVPSRPGVYFVRTRIGTTELTRKVVLIP